MSAIALTGAVTLVLSQKTLDRIIIPLVAFSAGSLLGGAFLHLIPEAVEAAPGDLSVYLWILLGFTAFFALEQFLHWHHCSRAEWECRRPLTYLILIGDGLHNFLGGVAMAGAFIVDIRLGISTWLAEAAHEIPQELGDFGVLIHGGLDKGRALFYNVLSALAFLLGGLLAYGISLKFSIGFLVPFAAGNFLYIAAADLVPELTRHERLKQVLGHLVAFCCGVLLLFLIRIWVGE